MQRTGIIQLYIAKGARVFYSYLLAILIPQYVVALGYPDVFLGIALVAILGGNVVSNLALTYLERRTGKGRLLQFFSIMMVVSGLLLATTQNPFLILLGCLLGNISTTGTEAGPFQSIEAGVLPGLGTGEAVEAFGRYNLIGYGASAVGAFTGGAPGLLPGGLGVYHGLFFGFAVVGLLLFFLYSSIRSTAFSLPSARSGLGSLGERARKDLTRISFLFSVDAFGGSFVSVYVLTSWFLLTYGVSSVGLGTIFSVTSVITAASVYVAASIGLRLGNLRTMVYTHLISNLLLIGMPLAGALAPALLLLFLRQGLSQMDVPTRQALMAEMFQSDERVTAFALSNTARSVASFAGGPVNTGLLALGALSGVLFVGGFSKIGYDLAIFYSYRKRYR